MHRAFSVASAVFAGVNAAIFAIAINTERPAPTSGLLKNPFQPQFDSVPDSVGFRCVHGFQPTRDTFSTAYYLLGVEHDDRASPDGAARNGRVGAADRSLRKQAETGIRGSSAKSAAADASHVLGAQG